MKNPEKDRIRTFLQQALPPIGENTGPLRDLWPDLHCRISHAPASASGRLSIPWFDWALAGGVAIVVVAFPASIPLLLYYL